MTNLKKWPFGKLEFGNVEQIEWVGRENEKFQRLEEAIEKEAEEIDYEEITMYKAECPECRGQTEPADYEHEAKDWLTDYLGKDKEGKEVYVCTDCGARLK